MRRREFDFLVELEGERDQPRLEHPKHVEGRWIGRDDLALLADNRGLDGGLVRHLVGLTCDLPTKASCLPPASAFLDSRTAAGVEPLCATWDPTMASQIATHVTVVYPIEIGSLHELTSRVRAAVERVGPFRLRPGSIQHFGQPERGIFIAVYDIDQG